MSRGAGALLTLLAALALLGAGCGGDDDDDPPQPSVAETVDPLPELPGGWSREVSATGGFAFGLPRGWKAVERGTSTLVRSFDRLVAISITPDRTDEANALPLDDFATRAIVALPGYEAELDPGDPRPFRHRYDASAVVADATATETGVEQRVELVVLRRGELATFTVVIAANAERRAADGRRLAERVVRTLRSRPVTIGSASS